MDDARRLDLSNALRGVLQRVRSVVGVPGIGAAISSSGDRVFANIGYADAGRSWPIAESSRFGIGCITKLLVAIVANKLAGEKKLCLDEPVNKVLEKFRNVQSFQRGITLRHLLSHTAGYQGPLIFGANHRKFNWPSFSEQLSSSLQVFPAGSVFSYENTGHVIVGEIIRQITGREISELVNEMVLAPLDIIPGGLLADYKNPRCYVAPHRIDSGEARTVAPSIFGPFWEASLADMTLSLGDMLTIGEAVLGLRGAIEFSDIRAVMTKREIALPHCISGKHREHNPAFFNAVCAEYGNGWFGYAGSALGHTCGLRFDFTTKTVCTVALNAWLPIARDALLDQLCSTRTHPDAGLPGGNVGFSVRDLTGEYVGGGNIIRSLNVTAVNSRELQCEFGADGLPVSTLQFGLDDNCDLHPNADALMPGVGFFAEPRTGTPCVMVGMASLKRVF